MNKFHELFLTRKLTDFLVNFAVDFFLLKIWKIVYDVAHSVRILEERERERDAY